jgi:hypothetical protein
MHWRTGGIESFGFNIYSEITNISEGKMLRIRDSWVILGRGCWARHWGLDIQMQVTNVRSNNKEEKVKNNDKIRARGWTSVTGCWGEIINVRTILCSGGSKAIE